MTNQMFGIYDSTIDDILANPTPHLDWLQKNKQNPGGWDHNSMYASNSEVNSAPFGNVLLEAYKRKIKFGIPFSSNGEVDNALAYNARTTDARKKISHIVSEAEDYSGHMTPLQFQQLLETNYPKAQAAGLPMGVYNGWSVQYPLIVRNSDFLLLHAYIPSENYEKPMSVTGKADRIYGYIAGYDDQTKQFNVKRDGNQNLVPGRLPAYAAAAKAQGKIYPVSILFSAEDVFGAAFYRTHNWTDGYALFMDSYNRLATPEMKQWLIINGCYMFSAKFMKPIKP